MKKLFFLIAALIGSYGAQAQNKFNPLQLGLKRAPLHQEEVSIVKRSINEDRPQRIVRSQWDMDSMDWLYFKDTTHKTYYTNGFESSERVVFPNSWGTYTTYTEFMYDGAGRLTKETYFTVNEDGSKDTSSVTEYTYDSDILVFKRYLWRSSGSTEWEEAEETRYSYELVPNTDLVSVATAESRSSNEPLWAKEQRTFFEYNSSGFPSKLRLEVWDEDDERFIEAGVYDTIVWHKWVKNDHTLEYSEPAMVEGLVIFLGMGRMRFRSIYDEHNNLVQDYTYYVNATDSVLSEASQNVYTYDSEGRTLTQLEKYWDSDEEDYINESYYEYFDYYSPTALELKKVELTGSVYPNPVADELHIRFNQGESAQLVLKEMHTGREVYSKSVESNEAIQLEGLSSGMYLYHLKNNAGIISGKLIKN